MASPRTGHTLDLRQVARDVPRVTLAEIEQLIPLLPQLKMLAAVMALFTLASWTDAP